jgi:hypothetical protein
VAPIQLYVPSLAGLVLLLVESLLSARFLRSDPTLHTGLYRRLLGD